MVYENSKFQPINLLDEDEINEKNHLDTEDEISLNKRNEETKENEAAVSNVETEVEDNQSLVLMTVINDLVSKVDDMNNLFIQKIQHTTHEQKIVDQMHAELQKYKEDMYSQLVRPILLDIIEVRSSITRMSKLYGEKPEGEQNIPIKVFSGYSFEIQDILEKNDIEVYQSVEGDDFTPIKQRAIKRIPTKIEGFHGKIAETMSSGYIYNGRPISPEKVAVYFYKKSEEEIKGEVQ